MTTISRIVCLAVPALVLLTAACSDRPYDQPNQLTWDPASTTYEGTGTNGGTDVDGAGAGGPRDPHRLVAPNAYPSRPAVSP